MIAYRMLVHVAGAPSPRKAMNRLKKALVENEKAKLVNKRAKARKANKA